MQGKINQEHKHQKLTSIAIGIRPKALLVAQALRLMRGDQSSIRIATLLNMM